jgi:hypothetical protein
MTTEEGAALSEAIVAVVESDPAVGLDREEIVEAIHEQHPEAAEALARAPAPEIAITGALLRLEADGRVSRTPYGRYRPHPSLPQDGPVLAHDWVCAHDWA